MKPDRLDTDDPVIPLPPAFRGVATIEMILPDFDFGPDIGVLDGIRLHDLMLLSGISDGEMQDIDRQRKEKGMRPLFLDEGV